MSSSSLPFGEVLRESASELRHSKTEASGRIAAVDVAPLAVLCSEGHGQSGAGRARFFCCGLLEAAALVQRLPVAAADLELHGLLAADARSCIGPEGAEGRAASAETTSQEKRACLLACLAFWSIVLGEKGRKTRQYPVGPYLATMKTRTKWQLGEKNAASKFTGSLRPSACRRIEEAHL